MAGRIKLAGVIAALLVILIPSLTLAQDIDFGVSPAVVKIDDLPPGEAAEFELTVHNNNDVPHIFTFSACPPPEKEMTKGRIEFPDDNWISFSLREIEVPANSQANVTVTLAIPPGQKWAGGNWETWLGVTAESSDFLGVELYVRLLVSTSGARFNAGLVAVIAVAIALLGYGGYRYLGHRARSE